MITDAVLPDWPPPDGEPIGVERARRYVAWLKLHAPPLVAEGKWLMRERYPDATPETVAVSVGQLATYALSEGLVGLSIGSVWCSPIPGTFAFMGISIRRDGRLELRPGPRMKD